MFRRRILRVFWTTIAWMCVGGFIAVYDHLAYLMFEGTAPYSFPTALLTGIVGALIGGGMGASLTVFVLRPRGEGGSFLSAIVTHTAAYAVLTLISTVGLTFFFQAQVVGGSVLSQDVIDASINYLLGAGPLKFVLIWIVVGGITAVVHAVSDHFGPELFRGFVLGRYRTPVVERRTFMFLDLSDSTTIAETLGHVHYFELLQTLFVDITEALVNHGGHVYQYVGDEVVVTWLGDEAFKDDACVACYFAIDDMLQRNIPKYQTRFGLRPRFRAGVHTGDVTTGEVGRLRTDIVHSGDVLNTAARIQGRAKEADAGILVSGAVLERMGGGWPSKSLGQLSLKGKSELVEVHRIRESPQSI